MRDIILYTVQPVLAAGFSTLIGETFRLAGLASNIGELEFQAGSGKSQLVVIELTSAVTLDVLRNLIALAPQSGIILWIDAISTEFAFQAVALGIRGILRKNLPIEIQKKCLVEVAAGELWVEKEFNQNLSSVQKVFLTPREQQLMGLLAQGLKNKEIAHSLGITEGTVKVYLSRLFRKVKAHDRFELALMALKNLPSEPPSVSQRGAQAAGDRAVPILMPQFAQAGSVSGLGRKDVSPKTLLG